MEREQSYLDKAILCRNQMDQEVMKLCQQRLDQIAKPLNSLGKLEDCLVQIAGIKEEVKLNLEKKALVIMCADNGIVEEGVTQTGQEVTAIVASNFLKGDTSVAVMAKKAGVDVFPIDIGMVTDTDVPKYKKVYGTNNFAKEPAMSRETAIAAIEVGIKLVEECKRKGYQILATGEMGIGNTTTSSALAAVLLDKPVEVVTGRGAGLSSAGLGKKIEVIKEALNKYQLSKKDVITTLATVGGLDIAGLVGICLGGMLFRIPVVLDGFISGVAALVAKELNPMVEGYLIASHLSKEPAAKMVVEALNKEAFLQCDLCLGEGTGAVAFFPILDLVLEVYHKMSTFTEIQVEQYKPLS